MKKLAEKLVSDRKKTVAVLSYPVARELGISSAELVTSAEAQAKLMKYIAETFPVGAVMNPMDLTVEAECFGAEIMTGETSVPEVTSVPDEDFFVAAGKLAPVAAGRTDVFFEGVRLAKSSGISVPVLCGVTGPFSLCCRLAGMTETMIACYEDEESVTGVLGILTAFISDYVRRLKAVGADGVVVAEPAAGLLSPEFSEKFSDTFIKKIFDECGSDDFLLGYHNCGNTVNNMPSQIASLGADIFHFGNAVDIKSVMPFFKNGSIVMGNLDPLILKDGTPDEIRSSVKELSALCKEYPDFMISPGCDIPRAAGESNIRALFTAVGEFC